MMKCPLLPKYLAVLTLLLNLPNLSSATATDDFPEWLAKVPGQPIEEDPDADGFSTFLEYALGAEPEAAVDPFESGSSPIFRREDDTTMVLLPFPGKRDVIYYLEGKSDLNEADWTILAQKLGNTPWEAEAEGFQIEESSDEVTLSFENWPDATFLRLRAEGDERTLQRKALAARFLKQATFGPTLEEIEALADADLDFEGWIDEQLATAPSLHLDHYYSIPLSNHIDVRDIRGEYKGGPATLKVTVWWDIALLGEDQLRQRTAWALAQHFVMGQSGSKANQYPIQWVNWYDILVRNSFGNFRDLLQEVTLSPKMGDYLTYFNNKKANGVQLPDENYAREVMQLFTIGLWHLNNDGTLKLDENEQPIPTYDNYHITELAKVFTGLIRQVNKRNLYWSPNRVDPMRENNFRHDKTTKEMFDGTIIPAGRNAIVDITHALDVLFNHSNTPPFVSYRLIQRLVSSNPSPEYVERVANVFIDNGEGERGDLAAVVKAILLDPEARDAGYMIEQGRGKLREPLLKFTQLCRAFDLQHNEANPHFWMQSFEDDFGMSPYRFPSVFNFYLPGFVPHGEVQEAGLVAPEFQILDDSTGLRTFRVFGLLINNGLVGGVANGDFPRPTLNYMRPGEPETLELQLASQDSAIELIDHLDLLLTHQTMSSDTKEIIIESVEAIPDIFPLARLKRAILLVSISPEFAILE
ncbi:MAG: DUF1800 domain-containing protein [Verrucomicrobia bacterium]|nr:DUF1800 domain-containing protein [Verrucomicrobiota bacterium]